MRTITVFPIPSVLSNNSYLELLYGGIDQKEFDGSRFLVRPFSFAAVFGKLFKREAVIVHVHWETNIYGSRSRIYSVLKMAGRFSLLYIARACGARYVWTMHNLHAHDYPHPTLDRLGRSLMLGLAQRVIIQNKVGAETFAQQHPSAHITYIPHPNYVGAYGPVVSDRAQARSLLGLPAGIVLIALGAIRPYKQLETLIDAVSAARKNRADVTLLIAGKGEASYIQKLRNRDGENPGIQIRSSFVPDAEIPAYLAAADYAVFAHGASSLTSGALLLALSYGTPAITFPMPAAEVITEGKNGFVVQDAESFSALLGHLPSLQRLSAESVLATVAAFSPESVGQQTLELYASLLPANRRTI